MQHRRLRNRLSFLDRCFSSQGKGRCAAPDFRRLRCEPLEDRRLLSVDLLSPNDLTAPLDAVGSESGQSLPSCLEDPVELGTSVPVLASATDTEQELKIVVLKEDGRPVLNFHYDSDSDGWAPEAWRRNAPNATYEANLGLIDYVQVPHSYESYIPEVRIDVFRDDTRIGEPIYLAPETSEMTINVNDVGGVLDSSNDHHPGGRDCCQEHWYACWRIPNHPSPQFDRVSRRR